jgi:hypothetical protein
MILSTMEEHCYVIMQNVVKLSVNIPSVVAPSNTGELLLYPQILDVGRKVCQSKTL